MTPPSEYLLRVFERDGNLHLQSFSRTGSRYTISDAEFTVGGQRRGLLLRMPAQFKARWDGSALVLDWSAMWPWGEQSEQHRWVMAADGKSFHDESSDTFKTRVRQHSADFDRQSDDLAELFALPEQPCGQHFKNIQVLKDLPTSALHPLMGTFQEALGVTCEYCHTQTAYDSDEKPPKKVARDMISLTETLNRERFAGRAKITCFTCHRGNLVPAQ